MFFLRRLTSRQTRRVKCNTAVSFNLNQIKTIKTPPCSVHIKLLVKWLKIVENHCNDFDSFNLKSTQIFKRKSCSHNK